ncbi:MAG: hypothetical protein AAF902_01680 [Chloroflexota bacterium]
MRVKICEIEVELESKIPAVCQEWQEIFVNHVCHPPNTQPPHIKIRANAIEEAPSITSFKNHQTFHSDDGTYSRSQSEENQTRLDLASGAIILFGHSRSKDFDRGELFLPKKLIQNGQVEDVTFALLAPIFRKFDIYIIHAFGAVHPYQPEAVLIIGPSGSGKTTSGLSLIEDGWHFLGNDAIFLSKNKDGEVIAWPSPGRINIHPSSIELLNQPDYLTDDLPIAPDGKYHLSSTILFNHEPTKTPVRTLVFPQISLENRFSHQPISQSVALTKTMEQSIDNWDVNYLEKHLSFLQALIKQTRSYSTLLSTNLSQFSQQVATTFSNA